MESEAQSKVRNEDSSGNLFLFIAAGVAIYVTLRILDPLVAFPLRQISSNVSTFLLNALSVPSTLSGTVISTNNFVFDVNPDCSGSTSLRIMLTLGALWFGMYPNLTLARRVIALFLAAPIAVFFNAVRVTALVVMGDARGEPVEGFPHEMVGVIGFGLAMGTVYVMTLLLAGEPSVKRRAGPRAHLVFLTIALGLCFLPLLWSSLLLNSSWVVGVVRLLLLVASSWSLLRLARESPSNPPAPWVACTVFLLSLGLLAGGTMSAVETLTALAFLGALTALALYLRGWQFLFAGAPLFAVLFLGLPHMGHYPLLKLADLVGQTENRQAVAALVELMVGGIILGLWLRLRGFGNPAERSAPSSGMNRLTAAPMKFLILLSFVGVLFQTVFNSGAAAFDQFYQLKIPTVVGGWTSTDLTPSDLEIEAYGREGIVTRIYEREGLDRIMLLVSSSRGKRFTSHDPRHCMTVNGWKILDEEKISYQGPTTEFSMMKVRLERQGEILEMRYWFDSDEGATALSTRELFLTDVSRRLTGQRPDWRVYRVFGRPGSPAIDQFIDALTK